MPLDAFMAGVVGVVDTQTPDDPSFIYVLGRFVLKIFYLSKHFIGPCEFVRQFRKPFIV